MSNKVYTIEEIKAILEELLKDKPIYQAILFGSYAKREATRKSDIDIVLDSNGQIKGLKFFAIIDIIRERFDKDVDVIEMSEIDKGSQIDKEVKKTGVIVYAKQG